MKQQNWQATYLHQVQHAQGVVVVHSTEAQASALTPGRGMWREADAVEYLKLDNPMRVKTIENPFPRQIPSDESLVDLIGLVGWAKDVLALPPVSRPEVTDNKRAAFNRKLEAAGGVQYPEAKTRVTDWYELVRLDLYDALWFCRRCSVASDNYILGTEVPPPVCPICGFKGYEAEYSFSGATAPREGSEPTFKDKGEARVFYAEVTDRVVKTLSLSRQALDFQKRGQCDQAMELNYQLERLCRQLGTLEPVARAFSDQAMLLHQCEAFAVAVELYGHAERICRELGDKIHLQQYLGNLGTILVRYGKLDMAMERYEEQERICRGLRNSNGIEMALGNRAGILIKQGKYDKAIELLKEQESICRSLNKEDGLKFSLSLQAQIREKISERSEDGGKRSP